ncbi:MAG: NAD(P)-dependent glycerol-3-phosphate dehydrogenase [Bacteriovoracaceae bacterium]|nr:NAD(P)-dependent glycerol-3-phosphate dehydrogenase [Bacteriovoracaceae bacterium]
MIKKYKTCLLIGAGAFGTSIASVLANNFQRVILKVRSADVYEGLKSGENKIYLPGKKLPSNITPALTWEEVDQLATSEVQLIVSGLPTTAISGYLADHYDHVAKYFNTTTPVVSLSKGIDPVTLELSDDLFFNFFPEAVDQFVFLSGPSFAKEILDQQITLASIAGRSKKMLELVYDMFGTSYFKLFPSYDVKGVLLGGALKNILAIAGGIIRGLGFTNNTNAAMITRGIGEMLRYGKIFNARPETFYGLSGMGDLILTTTGDLSRNRQFGLEIAKGRSAQEIIDSQRTVVEGYKTTKAVHRLSEKYDIRARIFNGVYSVLYEDRRPKEVLQELMTVPSSFEIDLM